MYGGTRRHYCVDEVLGDGAEDLGLDDAGHARPIWEGRVGVIDEDVMLEVELVACQEEMLAPMHVVVGANVQQDGDEASNIFARRLERGG